MGCTKRSVLFPAKRLGFTVSLGGNLLGQARGDCGFGVKAWIKGTGIRGSRYRALAGFWILLLCGLPLPGQELGREEPVFIGDRLELFVDGALVDRMEGLDYRLHRPQPQPLPDNPLPVPYATVVKDGERYRAWYRDILPDYTGERYDGHGGEVTCYAESRDGHDWMFPELGITATRSAHGGNIILEGAAPSSHNFTPFIDERPGVGPDARYKALGGTHPGGGLYAFKSADGIRWEKIQDGPVMTSDAFAFDSQNVSFWSVAENQYVCYIRTWDTPFGELRSVSRSTSDDFLNWSEPVALIPNREGEHIYTNATQPYFRAPHIYLAFPTRFSPERGDSTDILFMSTRAGESRYTRLFAEAFIPPGLDPDRWGNRSNYLALGVIPTSPSELSLYHKSGHRYTLRTDGFVSVHAGAEAGELLTRPLVFEGNKLVLNASTSAAGSLRVELLGPDGLPLQGFGLEDCMEMVGDAIEWEVRWRGDPPLEPHAGTPIRIRFVMTECDLYAFRFTSSDQET